MAIETLTSDVFVETAGHAVTLTEESGDGARRGARRAGPDDDPARIRLRAALREADFEIAAELELAPPPPDSRRRGPGAAGVPQVSVAVGENESAVLLLEAEGGVFTWQVADARSAPPAMRRRGGGRQMLLDFRLGAPAPGAVAGGRRGPVLDWIGEKLLGRVRTYVLRFVVTKTIDAAVKRLEGDNPTGPVVLRGADPAAWTPKPLDLTLPQDRPARILLMVHGTFSSTAGSFGMLTRTDPGRAFLDAAARTYDLVLGHDHHTLADDPRANAEAMLASLTALRPPPGSVIDAVAYSRGGLVYRVFAEELLEPAGLDVTLGKAVFVGCTNGGTNLAEPKNWADLVDIYTNAVMAAARGIALLAGAPLPPGVGFAIRTLGRFVQMFSEVAISERKLPGLAAMEPGSDVVSALNAAPDAQRLALYHAVTSSFEPKFGSPKGFSQDLGRFLADRITDRLFGVPNDLVVNTASMVDFGRSTALDAARVHVFGDTDQVYHTTYFGDEAVASQISQWLGLGPALAAVVTPLQPKGPKVGSSRRGGGARRPVSIDLPPAPTAMPAPVPAAIAMPVAMPPLEMTDLDLHFGAPVLTGVGLPPPLHPGGSVRGWTFAPAFDEDAGGGGEESAVETPDVADGAGAPQEPAIDTPPAPATVERYLAAEMEPYPPLGPAANVFVIVSPEAIAVAAHAAAATMTTPATLTTSRKLTIELIPRRNCRLVEGDDGIVEIDVTAPTEVTTRLRVAGEQAGEAELIVEARQGHAVVASFVLRPIFIERDAKPIAQSQSMVAPETDETFPVLRIYEFRDSAKRITLRFDLMCDDPAVALSEPWVLDPDFDVGAYVGGVLAEVEAAWNLAPDSYEAFLASFSDSAIVRARGLMPLAVRTALWNGRDTIKSIQIISDEALIPWELLCIVDPTGQSDERRGFLSEWGVVRWFHGVRRAPRTIGFSGANSRSVIPDYRDAGLSLTGVAEERAMLQAILPGIAPVAATSLELRRFLREDAATLDVLHFACHGEAADKAVLTAKLLMTGNVNPAGGIVEDPFSSDQVKVNLRMAPDRARSLVFLNSCQTGRGGRGIAGVSGFADAFIRPSSGRGAAVFIGALWSIDTTLAGNFAAAFYAAMNDGRTLVEAVGVARDACKAKGDFTWLAYSVYGHPLARIASG